MCLVFFLDFNKFMVIKMRFYGMIFILVCLITSITSISYASSNGKIAFVEYSSLGQFICIT
ncbi:MAG: hypothetical protein QG641_587, partial [Candidatus Poribacteria bacterium]|nr:hypothetical protein [Candidatus Poribacteria bacterium]